MQSAEVFRTRIDSDFTPQEALLALRGDARPFALVGRWAGGGAIVGSEPARLAHDPPDALALLDQVPGLHGGVEPEAVGGGWFGYLGYGLGEVVEDVPPPPPRPLPLPRASLAFYDHVLRQDHQGEWWFEALDDGTRAGRLQQRLKLLRARLAAERPAVRAFSCGPFSPAPGSAGYRRAVEACLGYIEAGDLYQANLALRLEAGFEGKGLDLFAAASTELRPAFGAYFAAGETEVVSLSPELFLRRRGREVVSAPIKGTRSRPDDPAAARAQSRDLSASDKDRAENVMIVDLMRNDLGRVCEYGSVEARLAASPEPHPGLWHLVSEVEGRLRAAVSDADLLRATFPPGSVTGAPKIKSEEVISTLEGTGREVYTGAIGFISPAIGLELNVAIRTFEVSAGRVWLGVGAGIVADSDPAAEYAEVIAKAEPLVTAAGSSIVEDAPVADFVSGPEPIRVPRPDPALGLLETLLVAGGVAMELDEHLDRITESSRILYGHTPSRAEMTREIAQRSPPEGRHRIRVTLAPAPRGLSWKVEGIPVEAHTGLPAVTLRPITVPGGLGRHKWGDRRLVDSIAAEPGCEALICDLDGSVLESGAGNIWIVEDDALLTPPADGRILPGATRSALIDLAGALRIEAAEACLSLRRVAAADDLFVTSSVRGIRQAAVEGKAAPPGRSDLRRRLAAGLEARRKGAE